MGIFSKKKNSVSATTQYRMVTMSREGFFSYDGNLYKSDLIRSAIRPEVTSIGKLVAKHIRKSIDQEGNSYVQVNPELYMKMLLQEPNPYMTGQDLQEKMATQLILNGNAFALIVRDANGMPSQLYPIPCDSVEANTASGYLKLKFRFSNGKTLECDYDELIHIKQDYGDSYLFGSGSVNVLVGLMEMVTVMDQGFIKAIKNSGVVKWLLKFLTPLKDEDLKAKVQEFTENYLSYNTDTVGAAGVDSKADIIQVSPNDYVPNAAIQDRVFVRIKNYFNTNDKIIQSTANEDEWNAYYEQVIEPIAIKLSNEFTRKLFTPRQRGFGNEIFFESANLEHVSLDKKLALQAMVDRGAMTPNEWRSTLNLAPLDGGDVAVRRLDTAPVDEGDDDNDKNTD